MTISSDSQAPLVVVVGATGIQGGSVVRNLIESDKPYRLRGLTRDATKAAALSLKSLGVEVESVTIALGNYAAVREAFRSAHVVFAVTNLWEHVDPARETAEGKLVVDAVGDYGYYFGQESSAEQQKVREDLPRRPRTFEEFLSATPTFLAAKA